MEKDIRLRIMYCPQCAAMLKIADETKKCFCPYCEQPVRPTPCAVTKPKADTEETVLPRTASAALSYARYVFENTDWDARLFLPSVRLPHTDALARTFLQIGAEDSTAWMLLFECTCEPALQKAIGFTQALKKAEELYLQGRKKEALYIFNSLRDCLCVCREELYALLQEATEILGRLRRFDLTETQLPPYAEKADALHGIIDALIVPERIEDLPGVKAEFEQRNKEVAAGLAEIGIDAEAQYRKIGVHLTQKQFMPALALLQSIAGYKNTDDLAAEVCKDYRFREILQITGQLYMYMPDDKYDGGIYGIVNGKPASEPTVKGVAHILTSYGTVLFYTDGKNRLRYFDFSDKTDHEFDRKRSFPKTEIYKTDRCSQIYISYLSKDGKGPRTVARMDLDTVSETVLIENASCVYAIRNGMILYADTNGEVFVRHTHTDETVSVCNGKIDFCAVEEDCIYYTRNAPSDDNKNLYTFKWGTKEQEQLLAANILSFCGVRNGQSFYTVGNKLQNSLQCTDTATHTQKAIAKNAIEVHIAEDGRIYAVCGDVYNRVLYCVCPTELRKKQLCDAVQNVLRVYCGNVFFTDTENNLCCVQTDGTSRRILFADVEKVLLWHDHTVYFTAADDVTVSQDVTGATRVNKHLSLYGITTDGTLLQKIACGIADAKVYSETEIDFFKYANQSNGNTAKWLFRFDSKNGEIYKLFEHRSNKKGK